MANFLRQIVAGPRARHPEVDLDLCYVTDHIIATSGPSQTYPQRAYRNPLDRVVGFLDERHGENWAIWEFRAEGTGYPDHLVYDRVRHYPWPDHHPPPFRLIPMIMASMRNWLHGGELHDEGHGKAEASKADTRGPSAESEAKSKKERNEKRVVVVHCKAGKGRSGTVSCSYLISEEGWTPEDALARFTQRRMRPKFGAGISIPSQLRTISYVDRWTKGGKKYFDRPIEIAEIHIWGLRDGVKIDVAGFADEGKRIEVLHTFSRAERHVIEGDAPEGGGLSDMVWQMAGYSTNPKREAPEKAPLAESANLEDPHPKKSHTLKERGSNLIHKAASSSSLRGDKDKKAEAGANDSEEREPGGMAVILRPTQPVRIANSDVQISVERRNKSSKAMGFTMVSAVAHVWFNTFFEGHGPEQDGRADDTGVFSIEWDAMDGIKGSSRKGARALDRMSVVWRAVESGNGGGEVDEPKEGEPVPQSKAADWHGTGAEKEKELGLRVQSPESADVSKASSLVEDPRGETGEGGSGKDNDVEWEAMRTSGPMGEELNGGHAETKVKDAQ
ncbi:dual specificity phosphatase, catalytic domain-containing protein [Sarocladium implicatum]|nr:dual specificity phosphatase, catalytic domain-containing protein [Sarocladium implicatum]